MKSRWLLPGSLATAVLAVCIVILTDWVPGVRGPVWLAGEWRWPFLLRPFQRWWLPALIAGLMACFCIWWLRQAYRGEKGRAGWGLVGLTIASLALQLALIYADRPAVAAELVDRTLAQQTTGYFRVAAEIDDLDRVLADYPAAMADFESEHVRTHPPGLLLANWLILQVFEKAPGPAQALAEQVRPLRCTDLWLLDSPAYVPAALAIAALLFPLLAALTAPLAYALARQLTEEIGARLAAGLVATLPALLLFAPLADQALAFLSVASVLVFLVAFKRRSTALFYLAGLILSGATFISLGNAVLLVVFGALGGVGLARETMNRRASWRWIGAFCLGLATLWLIFGLIWRIAPWEIFSAGMAQHYSLVTSRRSYGVWLGYNLVDVLLFAGLPVVVGFVGAASSAVGQARRRQITMTTSLTLGLLVMIGLLLLTGSTRGEVGRLWLFFFPLVAIAAADFLAIKLPDWRAAGLVIGLQLLLVLALGIAWRPVEAVIVVAQKPESELLLLPVQAGQAQFQEGIYLSGYTLDETAKRPGDRLTLTLLWEADSPTSRPYSVFVHLLNDQGEIAAQADGWPMDGQWPPTCWHAGEPITDLIQIELPANLVPGSYHLRVGLYDAADGRRLPLVNGQDAVDLGLVEIN